MGQQQWWNLQQQNAQTSAHQQLCCHRCTGTTLKSMLLLRGKILYLIEDFKYGLSSFLFNEKNNETPTVKTVNFCHQIIIRQVSSILASIIEGEIPKNIVQQRIFLVILERTYSRQLSPQKHYSSIQLLSQKNDNLQQKPQASLILIFKTGHCH